MGDTNQLPPRHYFVTGATGALGSTLVCTLLKQPNAQVTLLMRDPNPDSEQVKELFSFFKLGGVQDFGAIRLVQGDLTKERLGLSREIEHEVLENLTHIVHSAASVDMNLSRDEAFGIATEGTRRIISLLRRAPRGCKLDYVSTLGVAGRRPGLISETRTLPERTFHNTYEEAKAEAEILAWGALDQGLPVTIHRPSMIIGHSQTGRILRFQVFYFLAKFFSGLRTGGYIPAVDDFKIDLVPIDYVCNAIAWSTAQQKVNLLHLCAGPSRAVLISDLIRIVTEHRREAHRQTVQIRKVSPFLFRMISTVLSRVAPSAAIRKANRTLPLFLDYLEERQLFENSQSQAILAEAGVEFPDISSSIQHALAYYEMVRSQK